MHMPEHENEQTWNKIACLVPSKTIQELKQHYQLLLDDVANIEAGYISLPDYAASVNLLYHENDRPFTINSGSISHNSVSPQPCGSKAAKGGRGAGATRPDQERRKGIPWTEEEHR